MDVTISGGKGVYVYILYYSSVVSFDCIDLDDFVKMF